MSALAWDERSTRVPGTTRRSRTNLLNPVQPTSLEQKEYQTSRRAARAFAGISNRLGTATVLDAFRHAGRV
jgi:hypothetical protein